MSTSAGSSCELWLVDALCDGMGWGGRDCDDDRFIVTSTKCISLNSYYVRAQRTLIHWSWTPAERCDLVQTIRTSIQDLGIPLLSSQASSLLRLGLFCRSGTHCIWYCVFCHDGYVCLRGSRGNVLVVFHIDRSMGRNACFEKIIICQARDSLLLPTSRFQHGAQQAAAAGWRCWV